MHVIGAPWTEKVGQLMHQLVRMGLGENLRKNQKASLVTQFSSMVQAMSYHPLRLVSDGLSDAIVATEF